MDPDSVASSLSYLNISGKISGATKEEGEQLMEPHQLSHTMPIIGENYLKDSVEQVMKFHAEVEETKKKLDSTLQIIRTGFLHLFYLENGKVLSDRININRKTLLYYISTNKGPNSAFKHSEFRIRQYFSHKARNCFDESSQGTNATLALLLSSDKVEMENTSKVFLETSLHPQQQSLDGNLYACGVPPANRLTLFCRETVRQYCRQMQNMSSYILPKCTHLDHLAKGTFSQYTCASVPFRDTLLSLLKKIEIVTMLSTCSVSFNKYTIQPNFDTINNLDETKKSKLAFNYQSIFDTEANPGAVVVVYRDALLLLQKELEYILEHPGIACVKKIKLQTL